MNNATTTTTTTAIIAITRYDRAQGPTKCPTEARGRACAPWTEALLSGGGFD